jgi:hypothetical protein
LENIVNADIAVIGGGASGLVSAIEIKNICPSADVIIAERLDRTGKKILATGNGRCNLSNRNLSSYSYHGSVKNIMDIIEKTPSAEDFFSSLGVLCTSDSEGRIYPYSKNASSVLTALRLKISELGINELCGFNVVRIERKKGGYIIYSENNSAIKCSKIIISCGGYASPSFGTDGSMIKLLRNMGYKSEKICPAVAPLKANPEKLKGLKGVRIRGSISAVSNGKILRTEKGEIQFTENTVSGICVFNLAYLFQKYEGKLSLTADLMPEISITELEKLLADIQLKRYIHTLENFLNGIFSKNLSVYIVKNALGKPLTEKISSLEYKDIRKMAKLIKSLEFEVTGCSSWQNAQVTAGGISGMCIDENLQSLKDKGIYFAGEILDVHGDCGGFNLEWAWSSGMWAGRNCALSLKRK